MSTQRKSLFAWLHGWTGMILGGFLFLSALTGGLSIFAHKVMPAWIEPQVAAASQFNGAQYQSMTEAAYGAVDRAFTGLQIRPPGDVHDRYFSLLFSGAQDGGAPEAVEVLYSPVRERIETIRGADRHTLQTTPIAGAAMVLRNLHRKLLISADWHTLLLLPSAFAMLFLGFSGLMLQPRLLREMFTNPLHKRPSVMWRKLHKLIGAWLFPFMLLMGATALFILFSVVYLIQPTAIVAYEFDAGKAQAELAPTLQTPAQESLGSRSPALSTAVEQMRRSRPELKITRVVGRGFGGENGVLTLRTAGPGLDCPQFFNFDAVSGDLLSSGCPFAGPPGVANWLLNIQLPLHTAGVGGPAIAVIWFLMGLAGAGLSWLGMAAWATRQELQHRRDEVSSGRYRLLGQLVNGFCGGLLIMVLTLINLDILLSRSDWEDRYLPYSFLLVTGVLSACLLATRPSAAPLLTFRRSVTLSALLALGAPLLHMLTIGFERDIADSLSLIATHLVFVAAAGLLAYFAARGNVFLSSLGSGGR